MKIFEPLIRLPPERNESFEQRSRVGLGRFIVKEIVEGHGGTVSVESSVEKTVFTMRLPDSQPTLDRHVRLSAPQRPRRRSGEGSHPAT